ncbi:MAG: acyl-CoA dehydrogenase family protein [Acidimicrobiales bacterium]|jgi:(2S)-methylsuccinyl-CoA dehydrogenase
MATPPLDLASAHELARTAQGVIDTALEQLKSTGGADGHQVVAYDLAHAASGVAIARSALTYAERGETESRLAAAFFALVLRDLGERILGRETLWGLTGAWYEPFHDFVARYGEPSFLASLAETPGPRHLGEDYQSVADTFHRFADEQVRPHAEHVHRANADIPESVITGLGALGGFGLSVPEDYGGFATGGESEYLAMVVATEELSWGSLGVGGSLITRPEILTRALVKGGTEEQKQRWLPRVASGEVLAAIAVTEPDYGSDVAHITTSATPTQGGWLLNGTKTWCTFAARAEVLVLLARSEPDRSLAHRGLSIFLVEKGPSDSAGFLLTQEGGPGPGGGRLEGRPIDTLGYRGMHSYEVSFDNWFVDADSLVGGDAGRGRGFYFQMAGFENGRIQTAARALGVMQAAYEAALEYARHRVVFAEAIVNYELNRVKLGTMAAIIQCSRQYSLEVARLMGRGGGALEASMAKAYVCRAAEWVTREAMQIHGGMGYAEEYPVSRYFVDARVLSIFEGADETLCLKVIIRRLLEGTE